MQENLQDLFLELYEMPFGITFHNQKKIFETLARNDFFGTYLILKKSHFLFMSVEK